MKIASSSVQLTSTHLLERVQTRQESLEMWVGRAPEPRSTARATAPTPPDTAADHPAGEGDDLEHLSARDRLDLAILRKTFGLERDLTRFARAAREAHPGEAAAPDGPRGGEQAAPPQEGWGLRYERVETTAEHEASAFAAQGSVTTADGRALSFDAALVMERAAAEARRVEVVAGDAARKVDPLVLNLSGGAAAFSGQASFDLNADGKPERVARLASGSAYLAVDRDGNGRIDSGAELFGPTTGSGFGELAALDQDGNGWVDEGDAAFGALRLWNQSSGSLQTLRAAGVGAIYARAAATPFEVKDASGALQGAVAETGVFLREEGGAGTVQHVDLAV